MNKIEISNLFKRINNHYNMFTISEEKIEEWYKFLKDYDSDEVNKELDKYINYGYDNAPFLYQLNRGLTKIQTKEEKSWITCCDICGEKITIYGNDMEEYEIHFRKCSKIDFIDRMSKKYKGKGITWRTYYDMSDEDLDIAYHQIMNYWLQHREDNNLLKAIPNE